MGGLGRRFGWGVNEGGGGNVYQPTHPLPILSPILT